MLQLDGVSASIEGASVLRAVSFGLAAGERVALVGRNGAGKTSTLRVLMGLLPLTAGHIGLDGTDLATVAAQSRTRLGIGYAPEQRNLFARFTVEENLALPAQVLRLPAGETARRRAVVRDVLPELDAIAARPAAVLSGGQGKMVALGRALMTATCLLLLDEPFQGLAPALARRYAEALQRLKATQPGLAMIVTESNPGLLIPLVDRLVQIERGEIALP
jgi:branched-chain amino acid transport system ATP-binding protein